MAKKDQPREFGSKTRFELRFDDEVYRRMVKLAEHVGVSVNQLMQGITRAALAVAHPGESASNDEPGHSGEVVTKADPGCVWFGVEAQQADDEWFRGEIFFQLDFTDRRALRLPAQVPQQDRREVKRAKR